MSNWHGNLSPFGSWHTGGRAFSPASLFALNEPGVWFDPSDVANLNWRYNLLTWTEDFSNAIWVKQSGTAVTVNQAVAPDGTTTADLVVGNGTSGVFVSAIPVSAISANTKSIWLRGVSGGEVVQLKDPSLTIGTITCNLTTAWQRFSLSEIQNTGIAGLWVANIPAGGIYIWGAQLELGSVATTYQPITTVDAGTIERYPTATLYQDASSAAPATIPVTTPGQVVGLMLDKSKNLVPGPELVLNGGFASSANWLPIGSNITITGGALVMTATANNSGYYQGPYNHFTGNIYEITVVVSSISQGAVSVTLGIPSPTAANCVTITSPGTYTIRQVNYCTDNNLRVYSVGTATTASIDSVSVKAIQGNHAFQSTSASRPTYGIVPAGGRRNLLLWSEDFDNAAWALRDVSSFGSGSVANTTATLDPLGGNTADFIRENNQNNLHTVDQNFLLTANVYTASFYCKAATRTWAYIRLANAVGLGAYFNLSNGTIGTVQAGVTAAITPAGNGWYRCSVTTTATTSAWYTSANIALGDNQGSYLGDNTSGIYVWGAQLELGSTATAYQKVTTEYDVTETGVQSCSYLQFNGINNSMATGTITPGIDKVQVFAGLRKLSDGATTAIVVELGLTTALAGTFGLQSSRAVTGRPYAMESGGSIPYAALAESSAYTAPSTNVLTGLGDISGDLAVIRVNGVQEALSTTNQGTGNYLANPLYIGRRGGTDNPFNGQLFSLIDRFGTTLPATTITSTETWVAGKVGFFSPIITGVPTIGVS
jgi:hypothetical protein